MEVREVSLSEFADVYHLTYTAYRDMGYTGERADGELRHYPHLDGIPETVVLGVFDADGKLVGTNSVTVDGPAGLHVDEDFPDTARRIREWCKTCGLKLGASWRIATDKSVGSAQRILMPLIRATMRLVCDLGLHVSLYDFHPRHQRIYEHLLDLEPIAHDVCQAVGERPAVLMLGDSRKIEKSWVARYGKGEDLQWPLWPTGVQTWDTWRSSLE